jgi:hypothetical protein
MKKNILIMLACLLSSGASLNAGWFGSGEKERRIEAERQVQQQRKETGGWQIVTGVLAVGCVVLLTVGASIGSKIRRDEHDTHQ